MDGNGRWAKQRGLPRVAGHRAGAEAVKRAMQAAVDNGVEVLTLYAFSSENWRRSPEEIGDLTAFGPELVEKLERAVERTAGNSRLTLVVALNYGSQAEIAAAARALAAKAAAGEIEAESIDEQAIAGELQTSGLPPLDLLIRTSGEVRLSNFLLWQAAYAELLFG